MKFEMIIQKKQKVVEQNNHQLSNIKNQSKSHSIFLCLFFKKIKLNQFYTIKRKLFIKTLKPI